MGRKTKHIKLTDDEKLILEKGYKTAKSHITRRKCHAILLSALGQTAEELALFFKTTPQSVYKWFKEWESSGIKGLELKPGRGRPLKLNKDDAEQVEIIKTLVENDAKNLKQVLLKIKSKLNIELSKKTLTRFLKKNSTTDGNDIEEA